MAKCFQYLYEIITVSNRQTEQILKLYQSIKATARSNVQNSFSLFDLSEVNFKGILAIRICNKTEQAFLIKDKKKCAAKFACLYFFSVQIAIK